jgi:hypothetical protein
MNREQQLQIARLEEKCRDLSDKYSLLESGVPARGGCFGGPEGLERSYTEMREQRVNTNYMMRKVGERELVRATHLINGSQEFSDKDEMHHRQRKGGDLHGPSHDQSSFSRT